MYTETLRLSCVNTGSAGRVTQVSDKENCHAQLRALGDRYCTLQVSKDFIILKINVKITEKLSSVLLLNLEILQHQVFTPIVREIKLAAPFYIPTYKVKNSDKTFQTYELNVGLGTLFLSTFPTKHKRN